MIGRYAIVGEDVFDVARRIGEIDDGYFVAYSYEKKRFEVHNRHQRGQTLSLVVPYPRLDCRTVELVRYTRTERAAKIAEDIAKANRLAEKKETERLCEAAAKKAEEELVRLTDK